MMTAPKDEQVTGFDFNEGGRTYSCSVDALSAGRAEPWWWFRVSTDESYGPTHGSHLTPRERQWMPDAPASRPFVPTASEDRHRYAPFRADAADTQRSVQSRVVAYYDDLMARRGQPANHAWRRGAR